MISKYTKQALIECFVCRIYLRVYTQAYKVTNQQTDTEAYMMHVSLNTFKGATQIGLENQIFAEAKCTHGTVKILNQPDTEKDRGICRQGN